MNGSTVAGSVALALIEVAETFGVDGESLLVAADLEHTRSALGSVRLTAPDFTRLIECALEQTAEPALGLLWADVFHGDAFNPLSVMMAHAPTLRHALAALSHCARLMSEQPFFSVTEAGGLVSIHCHPPEAPTATRRFFLEMETARFYKLIRFLTGQPPSSVTFDYAAPSYRATYAQIFRGAECFDRPHSKIVIQRAQMDVRSAHQDEDIHRALRAIAERRVQELNSSVPFHTRVRDYLVQSAPGTRAEMADAARAVGLSVRSLRRRLDEEGTTFTEVTYAAQAVIAKGMLREQGCTIKEVAWGMGFDHASSFYRAFKRWTGTTPDSFRAFAVRAPRSITQGREQAEQANDVHESLN